MEDLLEIPLFGRPALRDGTQIHSRLERAHLEHGVRERVPSTGGSDPVPRWEFEVKTDELKGDFPSQPRFAFLQAEDAVLGCDFQG